MRDHEHTANDKVKAKKDIKTLSGQKIPKGTKGMITRLLTDFTYKYEVRFEYYGIHSVKPDDIERRYW